MHSNSETKQGLTVFFTGLSGAGKTTLAMALARAFTNRPVTVLDGDRVRQFLSCELGFSKRHRDLNIQRIGYVASEITKHGGICICSAIAPYDSTRKEVRTMVERFGIFILVHVNTPLVVCEKRDSKGLYLKARANVIQNFTGISDPYENPTDADLSLDTSLLTKTECLERLLTVLQMKGSFRN